MTNALSSMSAGRPSYDLVEVVDVLGARRHHPRRALADDEVHEVEEVARLLDERPAGVGVEAVPVADLGEEREAVLAHRHHPRSADGAVVHEADELGGGRHVAVLQADPGDRAGRADGGELDQALGSRRPSCTAASRRARGHRWPARRRRRRRGCGSGVATTTASHSPLSSRSRWSVNTAHVGCRPHAADPLASEAGSVSAIGGHDRRRRRRRCSGCARCPSSRCR